MTPWMDAIDRLRLLRYSINLDGEKIRYFYQGKGDPSVEEIIPLLEVLKAHKADVLRDPCFLIEQTLHEINRIYPEVRGKVKNTPRWQTLSKLEQEINRLALEGDLVGLERALKAYKEAALTVESKGSQGYFERREG
ncbi:MAG: hypothetical protein FJ110_12380 [Deltaproteobacteria bacterium]|nr:hypothetical protein [Deltaproteobacteria bacterium]